MYIRVKGKWRYLYRAVDSSGATLDFLLWSQAGRGRYDESAPDHQHSDEPYADPGKYPSFQRMFEKSCQFPSSQNAVRLHPSSPEAEVSTYSTEFDESQDFSNTLLVARWLADNRRACQCGSRAVPDGSLRSALWRERAHSPLTRM